jgi:oligopeptide/dipeptide ABC transporter ATP-binding protein
MNDVPAIIRAQDLTMYFPVTSGLLKRKVGVVRAVDGVSFQVREGETLGLVGESGSGKSTVGNCILRRYDPTSGSVFYRGTDVASYGKREVKRIRRELQIITQDPFSSLDPRQRIRDIILEGPLVHGVVRAKGERRDLVARALRTVGLNPEWASRFPHEFSGGQRQRVCIARSLALNPAFIVCDEIVSSLDVSIQAQIIDLMAELQESMRMSLLFIGHDLAVVRQISHRVGVMYLGKIVELASSEELYAHPLHPYTRALISAIPIPDPKTDRAKERILLKGEPPSPVNPPKGCNFCTRCPEAEALCHDEEPAPVDMGAGHIVACHHAGGRN